MPELVAVRVRDALADATAGLERAGCDTPRLDADLLLAEVLGVGRERLVLDARDAVDPAALERFNSLVARRAAREPVAYILGRKDFRWITVAVDRRVLIPRPETELLVEVGLTLPEGATVVDVGTGSGAVALALKHERPDLRISAVDSSRPALDLARENAHHLALDVHFAHSDLIAHSHLISDTDSTPEGRERFYAIMANLPYVPDGTALPPEVAEYEPAAALFGGVDGLDVIRRLLGTIDRGVNMVALEVGFDQAERVSALVCSAGFARIERLRDLAGHERVIVGWR